MNTKAKAKTLAGIHMQAAMIYGANGTVSF
jgi:hypothetical protein